MDPIVSGKVTLNLVFLAKICAQLTSTVKAHGGYAQKLAALCILISLKIAADKEYPVMRSMAKTVLVLQGRVTVQLMWIVKGTGQLVSIPVLTKFSWLQGPRVAKEGSALLLTGKRIYAR